MAEKDVEVTVTTALADKNLPTMYANGFIVVLDRADITLLLQNGGKVIYSLNLSFTTAKTLATKLSQCINEFEELTGNEIMTTDYIDKKLKIDKTGKAK